MQEFNVINRTLQANNKGRLFNKSFGKHSLGMLGKINSDIHLIFWMN